MLRPFITNPQAEDPAAELMHDSVNIVHLRLELLAAAGIGRLEHESRMLNIEVEKQNEMSDVFELRSQTHQIGIEFIGAGVRTAGTGGPFACSCRPRSLKTDQDTPP